jgi:methylphosphotriester-DNA--protein-cysteine methyltransferase
MYPIDNPESDEARWRAVVERNPAAVGRFFYAVRTTGVYCRPTCPSRPPKRANVVFFATEEGAIQAGFRACKRCGRRAPLPTLTEKSHTRSHNGSAARAESAFELLWSRRNGG